MVHAFFSLRGRATSLAQLLLFGAIMKKTTYDEVQVTELLYQAFATELGGEKVYRTAIEAAQNEDLQKEWNKYLRETLRHQQVTRGLLEAIGVDPDAQTPGRRVVEQQAEALVKTMRDAISTLSPVAAELVAAECVVLAETKDHLNWELIGYLAKEGKGSWTGAMRRAFEEVEHQEDHHLYHTKGWARELWIHNLGLPAALPPPEEVKKVETAIGAARAEKARDELAVSH